MGHKRKSKVYKLVWPEDHDNYGLEVCMKAMNTEELLKIGGMADINLNSGPEAMSALDDMMSLFASKLDSWNLEDDNDQPVPSSFEAVKAQDLDFIMELIDAWMRNIVGVSVPLGQGSNVGETSLEGLIPMEPLSQNQAS